MNMKLSGLYMVLILTGVSHIILGQDGSRRAKVNRVFDGDTFAILEGGNGGKEIRVRLAHVDCPEQKQKYGKEAREFTNGLVSGEYVSVEVIDTDRYGRLIAVVTVNGKSLDYELLAAGYAWHYKQYSDDIKAAALESEARQKGRGLWQQSNPVAPWDWRKGSEKGGTRPPVSEN